MNRNLMIGLGALAAVVLVLVLSALFTVHQTQQALVLQFGEPKRVVTEPGLHVKLPFVQNAVYIDRRVLDFDAEPQEVILGDQKRLVVDAFARYRILDPLRFYQAVGDEAMLRGRINTILDASLRKVLGEVPLFTVLSADRVALMGRIRESANNEAKQFGIDIVDVRIKRTDLPAENSQAIYRRMQTEREREAKELRAQGAELAQRIRSRADRERRVIIAEAERKARSSAARAMPTPCVSSPRRSAGMSTSSPSTARCRRIATPWPTTTPASCCRRTASSSATSTARRCRRSNRRAAPPSRLSPPRKAPRRRRRSMARRPRSRGRQRRRARSNKVRRL